MSDDRILPFPGPPRVPPALVAAVEAVLFASGRALSRDDLALALPDHDPADLMDALTVLEVRTRSEERGVVLVEAGGAWQLRTDERFSEAITRVNQSKPVRLSRAALEILSVVAWEQPVIKSEVDGVRGVDCGGTMRGLLERGLIRVSGRRAVPGRPLEYRTTKAFLQLFSLPDLDSLPSLAEARELGPDDSHS